MKKQQQFLKNIKYSTDAFNILVSYGLSGLIFNKLQVAHFSFLFFIASCAIWFTMSIFSKLYAEKRSNKFSEEIVLIIYQVILFSVSLGAVLFFLNLNDKYSSYFIITYIILLALLTIPTKYIIRKKIHAALHKGNYYDNVLLVGASPAAANFYETVKKYYYYGYKCIGYINNTSTLENDCPYFGDFDKIEEIINTNPIDEVFIALPSSENKVIQKIIRICELNNIRVRMLPDLSEYTSSSIYINNIGLVPVVNVGHLPLDKKENRILKLSLIHI